MKIKYNQINAETGAGIFNKPELFHYASGLINELYTHNKNYTRKQWEQISELKTIIDNITE